MKNKKKIWIFTIFPEYFETFFTQGVLRRSHDIFDIEVVNLRDFALNNYRSVDDSPYGGGPGMVMRVDVCFEALKQKILSPLGLKAEDWSAQTHIEPKMIFLTPRGKTWTTKWAKTMAQQLMDHESPDNFVFWCGRYEGIDERFIERYIHEMYSIGDYIISGGELAVQVVLDSALRFIPGILGNENSTQQESFENSMLEAPCYTKPREFLGMSVPEVLTQGNHAKMQQFLAEKSLELTQKFRPDLLKTDLLKKD
jgi:tRNA (guanine37-N1)-methyltransferase